MKTPNIILITVDSLRADYVYSNEAVTPAFDRLMSKGTSYTRAFAQGPFTTFSMPSLFTSQYPSDLSYVEFSDSTVGVYIDDEPTLTEQVKSLNYDTAGFHSNPLLSNLFGFNRGFETFDARLPLSDTNILSGRAKVLLDKLLRTVRKHPYIPAERLNERALNWIDSRNETPFFLWLHYMDVHGPYQQKSGNMYLNKYQGERLWRKASRTPKSITEKEHQHLLDLYQTEVEYTDECVGDLMDKLAERDLLENTLIALTADHGEQFGEHGSYSHPHQLFDELVHVPLILAGPDIDTAREDKLVELLSLTPTLVERAGGKVPSDFVGNSLFTSSLDQKEPQIISEAEVFPDYIGCVRTESWKYIRDTVNDSHFLFDLESDPNEQRNLVDKEIEEQDRMAELLDRHLNADGRMPRGHRNVQKENIEDAATRERLKDLGYLE